MKPNITPMTAAKSLFSAYLYRCWNAFSSSGTTFCSGNHHS